MKHDCGTCKFINVDANYLPCKTCSVIWRSGSSDNWQPAKPKRKDLQEQLDAAKERIDRLKIAQKKWIDQYDRAQKRACEAESRVAELEHREKTRSNNRFTMPDIAFTREELDAMLEDAKKHAEELEILKRYEVGGKFIPTWVGGDANNDHVVRWTSEAWDAAAKLMPDTSDIKIEAPDIDKIATNSRETRLMSELADLQKRYDALKDCYLVHEEPGDSAHSMVVDFGKVLVEHEQEIERLIKERDEARWQLAECEHSDAMIVANAEIESMHRELDAKDAIIAEQNREIEEWKINTAKLECELNTKKLTSEINDGWFTSTFSSMIKPKEAPYKSLTAGSIVMIDGVKCCIKIDSRGWYYLERQKDTASEVTSDMLRLGAIVLVDGEIVRIVKDDQGTEYLVEFVLTNGESRAVWFRVDDIREVLE